ncbi:NAD(P)H:quinone oxidoreductase [Ilumatobacter nonamiensis]|uniref:NAD(P)H:quinone oxidoreductase n=1 Tax=Ilumatobacter nonamiensis TaxID=467093 RepID=UPI00034C770D|nr:NAD(P)H:quinone oxidoreductase [Ilumatobacter nonamiensis]
MNIGIIYYSTYGSTHALAREIAEGITGANGEASLRRVEELMPDDAMDENARAAADAQSDVPLADVEELADFDGVIFGSPTRFGNRAAQLSQFLDQTGPLWQSGALAGTPAGFFTGASTVHGGHESTILTMSTFAMHHAMVIVPLGYTLDEIGSTRTGGGPYGPTHLTPSDGSKTELSDDERQIARGYGRRFVDITAKLAG